VFYSADRLRAMYAGGRADATARRFARFWAFMHGLGLLPHRWVTLEVRGRRSGLPRRFPVGMADWRGDWYLVSMLGEHCDWVRNVRAADGQVVLHRRRRRRCRLVEVPEAERPPILQGYLQTVPGARPHISVDPDAPLDDFAAIASRYPVFRVTGPLEGKPAMDSNVLKTTSRRIVLELLAVAVVTYDGRLPEKRSYAEGWEYVLTHPFLLLHVLLAILVTVESVVLVARCLRAAHRNVVWSGLAILGTLSLLAAFVYGDRFAADTDNTLGGMTASWAVATLSYAVGWYLGRRHQRATAKAVR
jgi:deazaflavin-dependent oxidoreductase (nitroreductase family)